MILFAANRYFSATPNTTVKNPKLQVSPDVVAANTDNPSVEVSQRQPSKRKLEEPDDSAELPPAKTQETYVKHPDHWAPDGNVLIQLGNTRFSVHQSRLATRSSWFAALFAARSNLPFDSDDADVIEHVLKSVEVVNGLDLFYLDDSGAPNAEEFAALLTAMDVAMYVTLPYSWILLSLTLSSLWIFVVDMFMIGPHLMSLKRFSLQPTSMVLINSSSLPQIV